MDLDKLSVGLKHLLETVDRLEFNAEQNRRQIAETRLLVVRVARALHAAQDSARKKKTRRSRTTSAGKRRKN